jgi:hypothetical protein
MATLTKKTETELKTAKYDIRKIRNTRKRKTKYNFTRAFTNALEVLYNLSLSLSLSAMIKITRPK